MHDRGASAPDVEQGGPPTWRGQHSLAVMAEIWPIDEAGMSARGRRASARQDGS
jgi:hypothetical protein